MTVRCAVLGSPVAHSLSPALHRAAYDALGLADWSYAAVEVGEDDLERFVSGLDDSWRGLSLTMPLKRAVVPLLDSLDPVAEDAGAVNTVLLGDGLRLGANTDVPGMVAAVRERYAGPLDRAVVVGGGATAASALLALADLECSTATMLVRDAARAEPSRQVALRRGLPIEVDDLRGVSLEADIVVSTVPAAAQDRELLERLAGAPVVFEVVYGDGPTPLTEVARAGGSVLVSGLDLLVHQAARQVALMANLNDETVLPVLPAMRAAAAAAAGR